MSTRSHSWCFTLNNYTPEEYEKVIAYPCSYSIVGKEVGGSETPHLQGYMEFKSAKRMDTLKKAFPRMHLEVRKGTAKQASDYCKKDNDYIEKGEITQQGRRTDLESIAERIVNGESLTELPPEYIVRYSKGLSVLRTLQFNDRTDKPYIMWRWGKAGVGKTRYCIERHKTFYVKDGTHWWDGYEQQEAIIIDDFDGRWPYRDLLRLLDRYPYQGQFKGGYIKVNSPYIYITCEHPPQFYWEGNELSQVMRRIDAVIEVGVIDLNEL